jgi:hypothetical protein
MSMAANDGERKPRVRAPRRLSASSWRLCGPQSREGTPGQRRIRAAGSTPASAGKVSPYYRAALQPLELRAGITLPEFGASRPHQRCERRSLAPE